MVGKLSTKSVPQILEWFVLAFLGRRSMRSNVWNFSLKLFSLKAWKLLRIISNLYIACGFLNKRSLFDLFLPEGGIAYLTIPP